MGYPVPTKVSLKLSPEMAMLFAPIGYTPPTSPVPSFLLKQNLFSKDIAEVTLQDKSLMTSTDGFISESANSEWFCASNNRFVSE